MKGLLKKKIRKGEKSLVSLDLCDFKADMKPDRSGQQQSVHNLSERYIKYVVGTAFYLFFFFTVLPFCSIQFNSV